MKLEFTKDWKTGDKLVFKEGQSFDFPKEQMLILLSGRNGIGKTTILKAIREFADKKDRNYLIANDKLKNSVKITDMPDIIIPYFSIEDDGKGVAMIDMSIFLGQNGLAVKDSSNGEGNLIQISILLDKLMKRKMAGEFEDKNVYILLDEPERGMDIPNQMLLPKLILNFLLIGTVICATQNHFLLSKYKAFNLDTMKYLNYEELLKHYKDSNKI